DVMVLIRGGEVFAAGLPEEVLTEENLERVYGVKCSVTRSFLGVPQVTPLESKLDNAKRLKMHSTITVQHK
ncbi:MAG: hypothetical protein NWF00_13075, partial [Candidatus Bathyarchaeota archaeon]|nr:hypothetical protein [Candidatus Bathyarchaeota archaeon]